MNTSELKNKVISGALDCKLVSLYGEAALDHQKSRYIKAIDSFKEIYGDFENVGLYSVPGRSELSGNHTDHNAGCVIACSIDLDVIAVAAKTEGSVIKIKSEGYPEDVVDILTYNAPNPKRFATSSAIIAGMSEGLSKQGYASGGFVAYTTSSVLKGSGLSSSAAFEVMVGNLINHLYNDGKIDNIEIAKTAQYAENKFFGKPCGLMDQVACANGGIVAIDFADAAKPVIEPISFDISGAGYALCITDTGGNHADLTDDYASVPAEMKAVAKVLGADLLRRSSKEELLSNIVKVREECGDRAVLRALHFFNENERVARGKGALLENDIEGFFEVVKESGRSSFCYLQNVYTTKNVAEQGISLGVCLSDDYLSGKKGAFRVHGGGFAGTIQAFVASDDVDGYRALLDSAFGGRKCMVLRVRQEGAVKVAD